MPIYEYECEGCKAKYEFIHKYDEVPKNNTCEECGEPLHRTISTGGFRLIGEWTSSTKPPIDWD